MSSQGPVQRGCSRTAQPGARLHMAARDPRGASGAFLMLALCLIGAPHNAVCQQSARAAAVEAEALKLEAQALALFHEGKYREAIPIEQKVVQIHERTLGLEHP